MPGAIQYTYLQISLNIATRHKNVVNIRPVLGRFPRCPHRRKGYILDSYRGRPVSYTRAFVLCTDRYINPKGCMAMKLQGVINKHINHNKWRCWPSAGKNHAIWGRVARDGVPGRWLIWLEIEI